MSTLEQLEAEFNKTVKDLRNELDNIKKQQIHLAGISTPKMFEVQVKDCQDVATKALQGQRQLEVNFKSFVSDNCVKLVTYDSMVTLYKASGVTLKEIGDLLCCDHTVVSRIVSGERKRDDQETYWRIAGYCSEKIRDAQKVVTNK